MPRSPQSHTDDSGLTSRPAEATISSVPSFAVYLGQAAAKNLDKAIAANRWGWRDRVLDAPGQFFEGGSGRERIEALAAGDRVVFAVCRPGRSLRRDYDPDREVEFSRLVTTEVVRPLFTENSSVWEAAPDSFRNRVELRFLSERADVAGAAVSDDFKLALNASLNRGASPFRFVEADEAPAQSEWTPRELLTTLALYRGREVTDPATPEVVALADEFTSWSLQDQLGGSGVERSAGDVSELLESFATLDPQARTPGAPVVDAAIRNAWTAYLGDVDEVYAEVDRLDGLAAGDPALHPLESAEVGDYDVTIERAVRRARRREGRLVKLFGVWLEAQRHTVGSGRYEVDGVILRSDLIDLTSRILWEAKADVGRSSLRLAIGQLFDYLRHEPRCTAIGVLLPRRPSEDLLDLCASVQVAAAWLVGLDPIEFETHGLTNDNAAGSATA